MANQKSKVSRQFLIALYKAAMRGVRTGEYDYALRCTNMFINSKMPMPAVLSTRASARSNRGNYDGAIGDLDTVIQAQRSEPAVAALALTNRGHAERERGNPQMAIADCTRAIENSAALGASGRLISVYGYMNRGMAYSVLGNHNQAIADCEQALSLSASLRQDVASLVYADRGYVYGMKGDLERSQQEFERALDAADRPYAKAWASWRRGLVQQSQGNLDGAIQDLTSAINTMPQLAGPYNDRAKCYRAKGDAVHVAADEQRVQQLRVDPTGILTADELAAIRREAQRQATQQMVVGVVIGLVMLAVILFAVFVRR